MLDNNASAKIKFWDPSKVLVSKNSKCHLIDHGLKSFNHFCYIWVSPVRWVIYIWKINSFKKIFLSTWKNFLLEFILIKFEQNFYRILKFHGNLIIFMKILCLNYILEGSTGGNILIPVGVLQNSLRFSIFSGKILF